MKKNMQTYLLLIVILLALLSFVINLSSAEINNENYKISESGVNKRIKIGKFEEQTIKIENKQNNPLNIKISSNGNITPHIKFDTNNIKIDPGSAADLKVMFFGSSVGLFNGSIVLSGSINEEIPIQLFVTGVEDIPITAISLKVEPLQERVYLKDTLRYKIDIKNLLIEDEFNITLHYSIDFMGDKTTYTVNKTFLKEEESVVIGKSTTLIKKFEIPDFLKPGEYIINVQVDYFGLSSSASARFFVIEPFWDYLIFGIFPVRWILFLGTILSIGSVSFFVARKKMESKKRYKGKVDLKLLPKKGERAGFIGKLAERNVNAYFDLDQLAVHTLIAGSTGGGKTVSAEILVEEALLQNVSVIVFDPTAQWTGYLRKCTNKKLLALYSKFGMKKSDARAFNGNVHQILDARQIIDINKYVNSPGEIHVFAINRLAPKDSDILVSNTIREVFKANFPESPQLKSIIIFDEVHRLLPKFGGSGEGFIQIERGAREFRKWGIGLILISQVLTDFIGETKANINTELQMRTRDEGDLNRIKEKYGGYMLQSLLKSATGTGMIENAAYNNGNPYFVAFRPPLHEHARLTDEEMQDYTKYNDIIDDLDFQIEQLEEEKIDVFDLRLELKMALDKVKQGSFNMVDIYLEGLTPRIESNFKKLGKKPKKRELKLVSEEELKEEFEKAKKEREKFEEEHPKEAKKAKEKEESKKAEIELPPLTLKNNVTVASVQELIDSINTMDEKTFSDHVNENENFFADWIEKANKDMADKVREKKTKEDTIIVMEDELFK